MKPPIKKFAWLPRIVRTWRPKGTKALIWLQTYFVNSDGAYCNHLGLLAKEFYK